MAKKHGLGKAVRPRRPPAAAPVVPAAAPQPHVRPSYFGAVGPSTYEEAILNSILRGRQVHNLPDEASLLGSALSSISGSMRDLQYRSGIHIGRSLYRIDNSVKHYLFPEEAIADLVEFFEAAGYRYVTYIALSDKIEISMFDGKGPDVGTNLHSFEAGIISGFISSAKHRYIAVEEVECVHNKHDSCRFIPVAHKGAPRAAIDEVAVLDRLAGHIAERAKHPSSHSGSALHAEMSGEYYSLMFKMLFDKSYIEAVKSIASYMGVSVGEKIFGPEGTAIAPQARMLRAMDTIRLLKFGEPTIKKSRPLHISVSFGGLTSKKEYVDVSLAYISALLSARFGTGLVATERSRGGAYVIDIKERNA